MKGSVMALPTFALAAAFLRLSRTRLGIAHAADLGPSEVVRRRLRGVLSSRLCGGR
jgi:hypothetical protein